ncbi:hypothetical protein [Desulfurococcus amylolyticus]|nr:hypothetical protein [Desulfurococcus amylolyticus]
MAPLAQPMGSWAVVEDNSKGLLSRLNQPRLGAIPHHLGGIHTHYHLST